jgi:hypothetical protein
LRDSTNAALRDGSSRILPRRARLVRLRKRFRR